MSKTKGVYTVKTNFIGEKTIVELIKEILLRESQNVVNYDKLCYNKVKL